MRIGILGNPCIDEILHAHETSSKPRLALGGILYSYAAMERLMQTSGANTDVYQPLTWHARADAGFIDPFLDKLSHLDRSVGLWPTDALTNRVQLVYYPNGERAEGCPNALPELSQAELTPALVGELDGLFVNMISGFDVSIDTLEHALGDARKRPFVHLDVHALVLGSLSSPIVPGERSKGRVPRGVEQWRRWLDIVDSVQLNEFESRWLGHPEITGETELISHVRNQDDNSHLRYLIITRGARGATLYDLRNGEMLHAEPPTVTVANATGSGDVFGSTFLLEILLGKAPQTALQEAVRWATWSATLPALEQILTAPAPQLT